MKKIIFLLSMCLLFSCYESPDYELFSKIESEKPIKTALVWHDTTRGLYCYAMQFESGELVVTDWVWKKYEVNWTLKKNQLNVLLNIRFNE